MKRIILLISFFLLISCDYSPLYSSKNNNLLNIEILSLEGDRKINSILKNRLRSHNNVNSNKLEIKITNKYSKKDLSKDTSGNIETYQLTVKADFTVTTKDSEKIVSIIKNSKMQNFSDKFEERDYEDRLKENMANSIYENLLIQLTKK